MKQFLYLVFVFFLMGIILSSCSTPIASFQIAEKDRVAASSLTFNNKSAKAESYHWDFGDGNTSQEKEPTHRYRESGKFKVTLTAKKGEKKSTTETAFYVDAPEICLVIIETNFGEMVVELFNETPLHRDNFLKLAEEGYYNDLLFHRVIYGFMLQGGDPNSKGASLDKKIGSGEPNNKIPAEITPEHAHIKGALAAARGNNPEKASSGAQYYIVHGSPIDEEKLDYYEQTKGIDYSTKIREAYLKNGGAAQLDQEYTVFGQVLSGFEVIDKIAKQPTEPNDRPSENIWMRVFPVY